MHRESLPETAHLQLQRKVHFPETFQKQFPCFPDKDNEVQVHRESAKSTVALSDTDMTAISPPDLRLQVRSSGKYPLPDICQETFSDDG